MLPLLAAYIPLALVIGTAAAHRDALAEWAASLLIFGGSAQLAAIRTLHQAGPTAAIISGLLINARLVVYSTSLARRWHEQPTWFRISAAGLIIDPTWAAAERRAEPGADLAYQRRHFLGAGLTLAGGWSAAVAGGALVGARLDGLHLQILLPLSLLGLVGAGLRAPTARPVIVAAAAVAFVTTGWPAGTGLLSAVVAGGAIGLASDRRDRS